MSDFTSNATNHDHRRPDDACGFLRCASGTSLLPKVAMMLVAAFLVFDIGEPWVLFDAPPSPSEIVALKAFCRSATDARGACPQPAMDPLGVMAVSAARGASLD